MLISNCTICFEETQVRLEVVTLGVAEVIIALCMLWSLCSMHVAPTAGVLGGDLQRDHTGPADQ